MMYRLFPNPKSYLGERSTRCSSGIIFAFTFSGDEFEAEESASTDNAAYAKVKNIA